MATLENIGKVLMLIDGILSIIFSIDRLASGVFNINLDQYVGFGLGVSSLGPLLGPIATLIFGIILIMLFMKKLEINDRIVLGIVIIVIGALFCGILSILGGILIILDKILK